MRLINTNKRYSAIDVNPDDLAAQLTLIDLPIFKSIQPDELACLGDATSRSRQNSCPNMAAMKRQFNQVTFWVVGQILASETPRQRAEVISHFIKTARRLYLLNNLHSSNAVVSALLSTPIYRLEKTWHFVRKKYPKEKAQLDRLTELYSDTNNYESLRKHLATCDLPCIPYLGLYSRDIIYINEAHQEGTIQRTKSTSKILESIEKFQLSEYGELVKIPDVHCWLLASRYIDELQKFVEEENYCRSLELEPSEINYSNGAFTIDNQSHTVEAPKRSNGGGHLKRSTVLAGLTSMVHSAVITTSSRFSSGGSGGASSPSKGGFNNGSQTSQRYLIDDSFILHAGCGTKKNNNDNNNTVHVPKDSDHTNLPPPISTSS